MKSAADQLDRLAVAERAVLVQDQARMYKSQQALTDHYQNKLLGVPIPEDEMIHIGDVTLPPASQPKPSGLSPLAAMALGLLTAAVPAAGAIGYLLSTAKPAIEKTVEKIITKPGSNYDVDIDMEVIPPGTK
jgi:hypothetical protein